MSEHSPSLAVYGRQRRVASLRRLADSPWPFILPSVACLVAISLYPLVASLLLSFQEYRFEQGVFVPVGLANYAAILNDPDFRTAFGNTVIFTIATVLLEIVLGLALALFMTRRILGKGILRAVLIIPMMTTPLVVGLMWRFLLNTDFGIVDYLLRVLVHMPPVNWLGSSPYSLISIIVVSVWEWTPFAFLIFTAGIEAIPIDILEAARSDGAGSVQLFWRIVLPLLKPLLSLVILFRGVDAFRAFDQVYSLTYGGPGRSSATLSFLTYLDFGYSRLGLASAKAYVILVVIVVGVTLYRAQVLKWFQR